MTADTATFFNSYPGMYMAQSFSHALVAAVVADLAMRSWKILDPSARQRFRLLVIVAPILSFPLYQAIDTGRSSPQFRMEALFDLNQWLTLEVWGMAPAGILFLAVLGTTSLVFIFQEMIPVLKHVMDSRGEADQSRPPGADPFLERASKHFSLPAPHVQILDEEDPVLFSTTGAEPVIWISTGLERSLDRDQREAALAHELAHIARNRRPLLMAVFVLRVLMFFNPVVLVMFRRAVRDEEKICDDMAVAFTGKPGALAGALQKFYQKTRPAPGTVKPSALCSLEEQSHNQHLESRIRRLQQGASGAEPGTAALVTVFLVVMVLNYFIV